MNSHIVRRTAVVIVACWAACSLATSASAQELAVVYAAVTDQNGRPVLDLDREEFQITEDGQPVEILTAQIGTEPMKVALLVDNGGSSRNSRHSTRSATPSPGSSRPCRQSTP